MRGTEPAAVTTFLFTDIEGSTRLWEETPERMPSALARHDALARAAVEGHRGTVVKMTGDGLYAAFEDSLDAIRATLQLQQAIANPEATNGVSLHVRCGLHAGVVERRDNDYFGSAVNRAARIMGAAHGGQSIVSQAVVDRVANRLVPPVSFRDLGAVRLRDLARPERVYQVVHPQLRQEFPALRSLEATPNNLPQQLSSFVGREQALAEVSKLLGNTRLLTLVGVGGLGKTRLSLQVGADVLDDFADGVWFVELAPIADARLVAQAVASVLGVKEEAGRPVQEALLMFVKDRRLLLILDNCEHLAHACAEVAKALLQAGPQVRVLASSREPLRVVGEATYPLSTLAVPDPKQALPVAALTLYEAVQLFRDRAFAAQPAFRITDQNGTAVADICHRLDGIPLAIELAAARVRALSVEAIAERLSDRFRLLTGGDATARPRQQTLRACIDWSNDLLTEPERALLRRLAVFAGGWTLPAAEAVGAGGDVDTSNVLDLLTRLVEKSLVEFDVEGGRYRLLETVRQYAQERLDGSGEGDQTRQRHLVFHIALAEEAAPNFHGPEQVAWLSRLDLERENLLAAHRWCDRAESGAELGMRLAIVMLFVCVVRGLLELGHQVAAEALGRTGASPKSVLRCRTLLSVCQIDYLMGRHREAQTYVEECLAIARELGDTRRIVTALRLLGLVSMVQQDRVTARQHLWESLALARKHGDMQQISAGSVSLADLYRTEGNMDGAESLYQEVLTIARAAGDRSTIAASLLNLAQVSIGRGSRDRAQHLLCEALAIAEEIGWTGAGQIVLEVSAGLAAFLGEWERALRLHGAAEKLRQHSGLRLEPTDEAFLAPLIAKARAAMDETALAHVGAAGRALSYEDAMAEARAWLEYRS